MKYTVSKIGCAAMLLFMCSQVRAQQSALSCQGVMGDVSAILSGTRQFASYNTLGDGYARFTGRVSAGGISGRMVYEGYTRTAPFEGVITTSQGALKVSVLDNTGGQLIIYGGTASLGPPQILGRFVCRWRQ